MMNHQKMPCIYPDLRRSLQKKLIIVCLLTGVQAAFGQSGSPGNVLSKGFFIGFSFESIVTKVITCQN
ncbi:hypothetical protein [Pedobacter polysacchareus]|uniref:hypothetical protein n=1 Tax=Pedobacter polysacchareus TaxID=2861973 RepID=UPI001C993FB9|nr:hypothetical protein [Pedobacter polysacchareus]